MHPFSLSHTRSAKLPLISGYDSAHGRAANDNARFETAADALRSHYVQSALRLLANHGLNAAEHAYHMAESERQSGTHQKAQEWMQICSILDRRLIQRMRHRKPPGRIAE
ncbi:hypothetical protein [Sphingorhabdus sp. Alg239-R122]|uniref:hypothetical protein n=1 Tax=Sphingorhabdus sp. Alg239-R122 TaxID=2305989 RepID=UPI0013DB4A50|nr:hypothetical protein [Sphingorhabdus sp. Alg239-R122]